MHFFIFGVLFFGRKRHPHFRFLFSVLKWRLKNKKKKVSTLTEAMHSGQNSRVTCSRIQPLSTSPPAEHEYCEAVSTKQTLVCCLCCCSQLVFIAPPTRKFLSVPPTSVASKQLFNAAGQIYSDRRSSLLGENADKLFFLAYNIRLFDYKY